MNSENDIGSDADVNAKLARMKTLANIAFAQEVRRKVTDVIVPFNDCGNGPPFYCVHPITGSAGSFRSLSEMLGPEQKFFGVQTPTKMRNPAFPTSIEEMSKFYVDNLQAFQPKGSFILGGHSTGAMIALEMAQQLTARGREVSLLVVIDGEIFNTGAEASVYNPLYWWAVLANIPAWMRDFILVEFTVKAFFHTALKKLALACTGIKDKISGRKSGHAVEGFINIKNVTPEHAEFMKALFESQYRYVPKPYSGKVVVCMAKTRALTHLSQLRKPWRTISPDAEFVSFKRVTHTSMIRAPEGKVLTDFLIQRFARTNDSDQATEEGTSPGLVS